MCYIEKYKLAQWCIDDLLPSSNTRGTNLFQANKEQSAFIFFTKFVILLLHTTLLLSYTKFVVYRTTLPIHQIILRFYKQNLLHLFTKMT